MPRKRTFDDDEFDPKSEKIIKRRKYNSRRTKAARIEENRKRKGKPRLDNKKRKGKSRLDNEKRKGKLRLDNEKRIGKKRLDNKKRKGKQRRDNEQRKLKSDILGMAYDTSSPFPPTTDQLRFTGQILGNAIAGLFAQQSASPEISYAAVIAEQLKSYVQPLIEYTMNTFRNECCYELSGDINHGKAAANKALDTFDKILVINDHYELMWDFEVWDIYHPPSLAELKQLSARHPH